jgi:hypothetical protein
LAEAQQKSRQAWRKSFHEVMKLFMKFHEMKWKKNHETLFMKKKIVKCSWKVSWNMKLKLKLKNEKWNFMKIGFDRVGKIGGATGSSRALRWYLTLNTYAWRHLDMHANYSTETGWKSKGGDYMTIPWTLLLPEAYRLLFLPN